MGRKCISFGTTEFDREKFKRSFNIDGRHKPNGGFWACSFKEDDFWYSGWEWYILSGNGAIRDIDKGLLFSIKDNAKIYKINNK